jgi:hypothetical protein
MNLTLQQIEAEAQKLTSQEKVHLFEQLLHSLTADEDEATNRLWADEATRRDQAIESGDEEEIPASEVFAAIRTRHG